MAESSLEVLPDTNFWCVRSASAQNPWTQTIGFTERTLPIQSRHTKAQEAGTKGGGACLCVCHPLRRLHKRPANQHTPWQQGLSKPNSPKSCTTQQTAPLLQATSTYPESIVTFQGWGGGGNVEPVPFPAMLTKTLWPWEFQGRSRRMSLLHQQGAEIQIFGILHDPCTWHHAEQLSCG